MDTEPLCPLWCAPVIAFWLSPLALALACALWGGFASVARRLQKGRQPG